MPSARSVLGATRVGAVVVTLPPALQLAAWDRAGRGRGRGLAQDALPEQRPSREDWRLEIILRVAAADLEGSSRSSGGAKDLYTAGTHDRTEEKLGHLKAARAVVAAAKYLTFGPAADV